MERSYLPAMNPRTNRTPPRPACTASSRNHSTNSQYNDNVMTASGAANNKRKHRDDSFYGIQPSNTNASTLGSPKTPRVNSNIASAKGTVPSPVSDNMLLAGYLAHEFLTKGTLDGKVWNPALPVMQMAAYHRRNKQLKQEAAKSLLLPTVKQHTQLMKQETQVQDSHGKQATYVEMTRTLKAGSVHLPGLVNPVQLARHLQSRFCDHQN